jgi:murein DD-endopeptidase MepM/ murein hydrolase activator NlpD
VGLNGNKYSAPSKGSAAGGSPHYWLLAVLLVFTVLFVKATFEEIIADKNKQIEVYQREIDENRNVIENNSKELQGTATGIDSLQAKLNALNDFLKGYQNQSFLSADEIAIETNMVLFLEDEVDKIQQSFKSRIINLYKHGKNYELELLMSSKTPNEFLRRNQYLQKFAQSRKKELRDLKSKKFVLEEKKKLLTLSVSSQRFYIESRRAEKSQYEQLLQALISRKSALSNENTVRQASIERKEEAVNRVKNFINGLIENKQNYKGSKLNRLNYNADSFEKTKGTMNAPLDFAMIENNFGEFESVNGVKSLNNGVDFSVAKGSKVYSVANGTVSLVGEVPFYGKVIIVTHDDGYRTVYSSMSEISVNPGDKIKLNQLLGKSGETVEGQQLHFELWQNDKPLNPKEWMRL